MKKILLISFLALIFAFNTSASAKKSELTIYTYNSFISKWGPGLKIKSAFEENCNCVVKYVGLEDGVSLLTRLKLEGKNSKADLVLGLDTNLIAEAIETGLFTEHSVPLRPLTIPVNWDNKYFIPYDYGFFAFIYDTEKVKKPPQNFKELIETAEKNSLLLQDPRTSTPGQGLLLWIQKTYPDESAEMWAKLRDKTLTISKSWSEAYGLFLEGEAPYVFSYTTSPAYHKIIDKTDRYKAAIFEEGHYLQIEVVGKLKKAQNSKLADEFLQFVLTRKFQSIIPETNWMYPVISIDEELHEAFKALPKPNKALLFSTTDVKKNRKKWLKSWLSITSQK